MQLLKAFGLGLVASGKRAIRAGREYDKYFSLSGVEGNEVSLMANGNVSDTITLMKKVVRETLAHTKKIAQVLQGNSRLETARNLYNFLYQHVQYTKDNPLREQLRTPLRTWADRKRGVDCDCYSIFISSVLTNLGIPHYFRVAGYNGGDYQHVYVVVPDGNSKIIIDPVVDQFNSEHPYTSKKDFNMHVTMLNGFALGACPAPTNNAASTIPGAAPIVQPAKAVQFKPFDYFSIAAAQDAVMFSQPAPDQPAPTPAVQPEATPQKLQASADTTGTKVMVGLGLAALALALVSAFNSKPKTSLSGPATVRKRLSVVQL